MNFPDYKRFLESYMGDDAFRGRFDGAPEAALSEAGLKPGKRIYRIDENYTHDGIFEFIRNSKRGIVRAGDSSSKGAIE